MYTNTKLLKGALRLIEARLAAGNGSGLVLTVPSILIASEEVGEEGDEHEQLLLRGPLDSHVAYCLGIMLAATDPTETPSFHCGVPPVDGRGDYFGLRRSFADAIASATLEGSLLSTNPPFVTPDCFTFGVEGGLLDFDEGVVSAGELNRLAQEDPTCLADAWNVFTGIVFKEVSDLAASAREVVRFHEELEKLADQP